MLLVFILYHVHSCDSGCDLWQTCEGDDALGLLQHQRSISRILLLRDFSSAESVLHASINHILSVLLVNWRVPTACDVCCDCTQANYSTGVKPRQRGRRPNSGQRRKTQQSDALQTLK